MNKYLYTILLIFISNLVFAQKEKPCGMKDGLQEGTCKQFFGNGKVSSILNWKKGKREGTASYFYENGQVKSTGNFTKDKRNGEWKYFYENGILEADEFYVFRDFAELKEGTFKKFYKDGKVSETCAYVDDKLEGNFTSYFSNGGVSQQGAYSKDKQVSWGLEKLF